MRSVLPLAACVLAGCNWVLGLDAPTAGGDGGAIDAPVAIDAIDAPTGDVDASDAMPPVIRAVAAGAKHTCILRNDEVRCWGRGAGGQLGYGNLFSVGDDEPPLNAGPVSLGDGIPIELAAGDAHTCVLLDTGGVKCWGTSLRGQVGQGDRNTIGDDEVPATIDVINIGAQALQLAAGALHTCAALQGGRVRCWGAGDDGRLGYGNENDVGDDEVPFAAGDVGGVVTIFSVAAGAAHTCALRSDGTVTCWGAGTHGRLGYGNVNPIGDNEAPGATVMVGGPVQQLVAGEAHTCALLVGGTVRCWGFGADGRLGYDNSNDLGDNETPDLAGDVDVGGTVKQLAAGAAHTCALLDGGTVRCWGRNDHGQLGYGNTTSIGDNEVPAVAGDVTLGAVAKAITAGGDHTCALLDGGLVRCWGAGADGQLGTASTLDLGDDESPASVPPIGP